ncbi:MAG: hypothetical protein GY906_24080 [bacterium]|nr:hypothetical protein [bacterium]
MMSGKPIQIAGASVAIVLGIGGALAGLNGYFVSKEAHSQDIKAVQESIDKAERATLRLGRQITDQNLYELEQRAKGEPRNHDLDRRIHNLKNLLDEYDEALD